MNMDEEKKKKLYKKWEEFKNKRAAQLCEEERAELLRRGHIQYANNGREALRLFYQTTRQIIKSDAVLEPEEGIKVLAQMGSIAKSKVMSGYAQFRHSELLLSEFSNQLNQSSLESVYYVFPHLSAFSAVLRLQVRDILGKEVLLWSQGTNDIIVTSIDFESGFYLERERFQRCCGYYLEVRSWGQFDLSELTVATPELADDGDTCSTRKT